jgi:hypothetical protein
VKWSEPPTGGERIWNAATRFPKQQAEEFPFGSQAANDLAAEPNRHKHGAGTSPHQYRREAANNHISESSTASGRTP